MKPTLVIMAAGMGSRYGGLKQLDPLGPNGETIMDYSIFDALRAGFGKVVFVIRESFREDFHRVCLSRYGNHFNYAFVAQELTDLPAPYTLPAGREKPWGTAHALLTTEKVVDTPFAIINADDYYGPNAFEVMAQFLSQPQLAPNAYAMAGYQLDKTLSPSGPVARGICQRDAQDLLTGVVERFKIEKNAAGEVVCQDEETQSEITLHSDDLCSMNFWGFQPGVYPIAHKLFKDFLSKKGTELKSEYYLPTMVNQIIEAGEGSCKVLKTSAQWFGVTYRDDRESVVARLASLHREGLYPNPLF